MKAKIKSHGIEVKDFCHKNVPKVDPNHSFLAVISLNSTLKKDRNCYPQVFFKKCKYIEKKVMRHIINDLESSSDDSDDFDEE